MTDKALLDHNVAINVPLDSYGGPPTKMNDAPPPYENPTIDFSSGWKDRVFAFIFYIHATAVIIVGIVLGVPFILSSFQGHTDDKKGITGADSNPKLFMYGLGGAAAVSGIVSFATYFILQLCAGRLVVCSLILVVTLEIATAFVLFIFVHWIAITPILLLLLITLIFICCIRKRIPFAEVHLRVACAVLRSHPSLIFITFIMFIVEVLWVIFWCLMVVGILHATNQSILASKNDTATSLAKTTTTYTRFQGMNDITPTPTPTPFTRRANVGRKNGSRTKTTTYGYNPAPRQIVRRALEEDYSSDRSSIEESKEQNPIRRIGGYIIIFLLLLSYYWGSVTLANIPHFITACTVGHWWFTGDAAEQYQTGTSIKRALTTNFGTICLGSLVEAIIKALRREAEGESHLSILGCIARCILRILEKIIGYLNDWAFVFRHLLDNHLLKLVKVLSHYFANVDGQ